MRGVDEALSEYIPGSSLSERAHRSGNGAQAEFLTDEAE